MNIFVWGTGRQVGKVIDRHIPLSRICGFIDNNKEKTEFMGLPVYRPEQMVSKDFDAILVCTLFSEEIINQCKTLGIDTSKVICLYGNCVLKDFNEDYDFVKNIVGEEFAKVVKERYKVIRNTEAYGELFLKDVTNDNLKVYMKTDFVRTKTFELVVKELKKRNLSGAVAELGVFRGEFAQYINAAFPEKTLYLFDTFEGFNAEEALREKKSGNCSESFIQAYKETNIETVLNRMTSLDNVVIKQGFFPESAEGLEDVFSFVSLDVDFEESIYQGLVYFYPRLQKGGYIFIHDYNSDLLGVEKAVDRYEKDYDVMLCKTPICDANGTLIITK